jgi:uroporphyrinogen-III synthase
MRLLVTRPFPQGEQTGGLLREQGHETLLAPLLRIETLTADLGHARWDAVAATSANAIRAIAAHPRLAEISQLPLFTVGGRTAQAALEAGFADVTSADGDADALMTLIRKSLAAGSKLLYFAGEDRASDVAAGLAPNNISVTTAVVYRAVAEPMLPVAVCERLRAGTIDGVLHFSKRSAQTFVTAARTAGLSDNSLKCHHFCLALQVAAPLLEAGARHVHVAARPDEAAVLELVGQR